MIDVRVRRSLSTDEELYSPNSQAMSRRESFMTMPELRTVIFHHDDCLKHRPSNTHQEAPERLSAIFRQLFNQVCICTSIVLLPSINIYKYI